LSEEFTNDGIWWFRRVGNENGDYWPRGDYQKRSRRRRWSVGLAVFVMERGVPNYRFLAGRARNEERVCWRFNQYYSIVPVFTGLVVAISPPVTVLVWCKKAVVITFFVGCVEMCSIGTRKQLEQFEKCKIETGYLLQPVQSSVI
jgi:hypothetical protein